MCGVRWLLLQQSEDDDHESGASSSSSRSSSSRGRRHHDEEEENETMVRGTTHPPSHPPQYYMASLPSFKLSVLLGWLLIGDRPALACLLAWSASPADGGGRGLPHHQVSSTGPGRQAGRQVQGWLTWRPVGGWLVGCAGRGCNSSRPATTTTAAAAGGAREEEEAGQVAAAAGGAAAARRRAEEEKEAAEPTPCERGGRYEPGRQAGRPPGGGAAALAGWLAARHLIDK